MTAVTVSSDGVKSAPEDTSAWAPLKIAIYRNLFIAQLVSNIGTWMQTVGAQWFLVEHHSSATIIALVQTASLTPTLVLGLFGGVFADLFDRRRLLIVIQTYAVLAAAVLAAIGVHRGSDPDLATDVHRRHRLRLSADRPSVAGDPARTCSA